MSYIMGVNAGANAWHDASACLIDDAGRVLAFVEQERLTRERHAPKDHAPAEAIARVLALAGIDVDQVDAVAVGWDEPRVAARAGTPWRFDSAAEFLRELGLTGTGSPPDLCFVPHHRAHAASAFYASPYDTSAVVVVDGSGEDESMSIFTARRGHPLIRLAAWPQVHSLGHFYEGISRWLGLGKYGAGKVMGLAAYGHGRPVATPRWITSLDNRRHLELTSAVGSDPGWVYEDIIARWADLLADYAGASSPVAAPFELAGDPIAVEIAAAGQATVESIVGALVARARADTGIEQVCLAGGVALNCAANGRLPGQVYVPPMPHDAGVALGAAWSLQPPTQSTVFDPYTGGPPGPLPDGHAALADARIEDAEVDKVVELLLGGQIVGMCRGRSEVGPRALCHRSLLASPRTVGMRDRVNSVKRREPWRPFGPVSLAHVDHGLWTPIGHLERYMVGAAQLTDLGERDIPAVRHVDGTTRPQRLGTGDEPFVEAVLGALARAGHPPVLLNTSFNGPGEPLVEDAAQALTCARSVGVPVCVVDETLIRFPAAMGD